MKPYKNFKQKSEPSVFENHNYALIVNHVPFSSLVGECGKGVQLLLVGVLVARFHFDDGGRGLGLPRGAAESLQEPNLLI